MTRTYNSSSSEEEEEEAAAAAAAEEEEEEEEEKEELIRSLDVHTDTHTLSHTLSHAYVRARARSLSLFSLSLSLSRIHTDIHPRARAHTHTHSLTVSLSHHRPLDAHTDIHAHTHAHTLSLYLSLSLSISPSPQAHKQWVLIGPLDNHKIPQIITEYMWGNNEDPTLTVIDLALNTRLSAGFRGQVIGCSDIRFSEEHQPVLSLICGSTENVFDISVNLNDLITTKEDLIGCSISDPASIGPAFEKNFSTEKKSQFGLEGLPGLGGEIEDKVGVRLFSLSFASVLKTLIDNKGNSKVREWVKGIHNQAMKEVYKVMSQTTNTLEMADWFSFTSPQPIALSLEKKTSHLTIDWAEGLQKVPQEHRGLFLLAQALDFERGPLVTVENFADKNAFYLAAKQDTKALRKHFPCFETGCGERVEPDNLCAIHIKRLLELVLEQGRIGDHEAHSWFQMCFSGNTTSIKQCAEVIVKQQVFLKQSTLSLDQTVAGFYKDLDHGGMAQEGGEQVRSLRPAHAMLSLLSLRTRVCCLLLLLVLMLLVLSRMLVRLLLKPRGTRKRRLSKLVHTTPPRSIQVCLCVCASLCAWHVLSPSPPLSRAITHTHTRLTPPSLSFPAHLSPSS